MTHFFLRLWRILTRPIWESESERSEREWLEDARALLATRRDQ